MFGALAALWVTACIEEHPDWVGADSQESSEVGTATSNEGSTSDTNADTTAESSDSTSTSDDTSTSDTTSTTGDGDGDGDVCGSACPWFDDGFGRRNRLRIDGADIGESLTDFPVHVRIDASWFDYAAAGPDGDDLRFFDDSGTPLDFEIEAWDATGVSTAWVRIPAMSANQDYDFWAYYDNAAPAPAPDPRAVWDSSERGVWHLQDLSDATGTTPSGTNVGTTTTPGVAGAGRAFGGTGERIEMPNSAPLQILGDLSISAMVRYQSFDADPNSNTFLMHAGVGTKQSENALYRVEYVPSSLSADDVGMWLVWEYAGGRSLIKSPSAPTELEDGDWHHLVFVRDAGTEVVLFYVDGEVVPGGPKSWWIPPASGGEGILMLGANPRDPTVMNFAGELDEVRISATVRSSAYIAADHLSVTGALVAYDPVETQ